MQTVTLKDALAHLRRHSVSNGARRAKGAITDGMIAARATKILRGWGGADGEAHGRVSRSLVCMVRNGEARKATGPKARAAWTAMAEMKLIPGVPAEVLARENYWKEIRAVQARRRGDDRFVKEVPVLTPALLRYFGLERNPVYDEIKSSKDIWWGAQHKEARSVLIDAVEEGRFVRLAGLRGVGKSLIGYLVREELARRDDIIVVDPGAIMTDVMKATHLITAVIQAIKRREGGRDEIYQQPGDAMKRAHAMRYLLVQQRRQNRRVVIWIDEAHELRASTFLALKRLLDEVEGIGRRLLSIVLIGQNPEAAQNARVRDLSEVTRRLQTYRIEPMNDEMPGYLRWKIQRAGGAANAIITPSALEAIAAHAPTPLDANVVFAHLLISGYQDKLKPIRREHVDAVPDDSEREQAAGE